MLDGGLKMEDLHGIWNGLYEEAIPKALKRLQNIPGVVIGFHSVVDGIKRVVPSQVRAVLGDPEVRGISLEHLRKMPEEISTAADFIKGLLYTLHEGRSFRMVINEEGAFRWIMDRFGYDRLRLGGTSGCMANALAPLGIRRILVYANPPTRALMDLFGRYDNLWVLASSGEGKTALRHPWEAGQQGGLRALHWGFEFDEGTSIQLSGGVISAPRSGRFYACWNPVNNRLEISEIFRQGILEHIDSFSHMIVAGYQLLSPNYPDGSTCMDYIPRTVDFLTALKRVKPDLHMHLELDTIPSRSIRKGVLDLVMPCVDSVGLNEVELDFLVRDLEGREVRSLGGSGEVTDYVRGMVFAMERVPIRRMHLHTDGCYLCLLRGGDSATAREALMLAAAVAASRAKFGEIENLDFFDQIAEAPFSHEGLLQMKALMEGLGLSADFQKTGLAVCGRYRLIFVPTKVIQEPTVTVGLGDTISAVGFLAGSADV